MLPYNGQGASQAIEDAYALAKCLEAYCDKRCESLESTLRIFESIRLSRTAGNQASARQAGYLFQQLGDMKDVVNEEKRFEMMVEKVQTRMHWIHAYDVDAEIKEKLKTL
jgi:2-polyprenyl-6-methoxyphenol hydroxylase-like FAD-dependent oxidoreductase